MTDPLEGQTISSPPPAEPSKPDAWDTVVMIRGIMDRSQFFYGDYRKLVNAIMGVLDATNVGCIGVARPTTNHVKSADIPLTTREPIVIGTTHSESEVEELLQKANAHVEQIESQANTDFDYFGEAKRWLDAHEHVDSDPKNHEHDICDLANFLRRRTISAILEERKRTEQKPLADGEAHRLECILTIIETIATRNIAGRDCQECIQIGALIKGSFMLKPRPDPREFERMLRSSTYGKENADERHKLKCRIISLESALRPLVEAWAYAEPHQKDLPDDARVGLFPRFDELKEDADGAFGIELKDLRRARAALAEADPSPSVRVPTKVQRIAFDVLLEEIEDHLKLCNDDAEHDDSTEADLCSRLKALRWIASVP